MEEPRINDQLLPALDQSETLIVRRESYSFSLKRRRVSRDCTMGKVEKNSHFSNYGLQGFLWRLFSPASWPVTLLETTRTCLHTSSLGLAGPQHLEREYGVPLCTPAFLVLLSWPSFNSKRSHKVRSKSSETKSLVMERGWHMDSHWGLLSRSFKTTSNCRQSKFQRTWLRFASCSPIKYSKMLPAYAPVLGILNVTLFYKREVQIV